MSSIRLDTVMLCKRFPRDLYSLCRFCILNNATCIPPRCALVVSSAVKAVKSMRPD